VCFEGLYFASRGLYFSLLLTPRPFYHRYTFGIIDILQKYNMQKYLEGAAKV
jgi:hypothetical protein